MQTRPSLSETGLTEMEAAVMDGLSDAVEAYNLLEVQHEDEPAEFIAAIHRLQDMMAMRAMRRSHPEYWLTYGS